MRNFQIDEGIFVVLLVLFSAGIGCNATPDTQAQSQPSASKMDGTTKERSPLFLFDHYSEDFVAEQLCSRPDRSQGNLRCYPSGWKPWVNELVKRTAGQQFESIESDSDVQSPGIMGISWDESKRFVFKGCRPHQCPEAYVYFIVSSKPHEIDIVWVTEHGVRYIGPNAEFLQRNGLFDLIEKNR